jgi:hypothetical protein
MKKALVAILNRSLMLVLAVAFAVSATGDSLDLSLLYNRLLRHTGSLLFNYGAWEMDALRGKLVQEVSSPVDAMDETARSAYVRDYLALVGQLQTLENQIEQIFSDARISDAQAQSAALRSRRDALQLEVERRQPLAETIVQGQIASVLRDEGFTLLGQVLPPVSAHITELPALLVVSPRDVIRVETSVNIVDLPADRATTLENAVDADLNMSSLVAPLGGLSLYPSMVYQTWHAPSLFEVVAHEWCHHYLYFFPLGLGYDNAETRVINETTASYFGEEIARKTLLRFYGQYPELIAQIPPPPTSKPVPDKPEIKPSPPAFNYGAALNQTRLTVDVLLRLHQPRAAEIYMALARYHFAANGYPIRKLNQAFFAFYGGYQGDGGGGAGGTDPTGAAILTLREHRPSVRAWLETMRVLTTREALLRAAGTA